MKKELKIEEKTKEVQEVVKNQIVWEDDKVDYSKAVVTGNLRKKTMMIKLDEDNYIKTRCVLTWGEKKALKSEMLGMFELTGSDLVPKMKKDIKLQDIFGKDKDTELENMIYTEFFYDGEKQSLKIEDLNKNVNLLEMREKLLDLVKEHNGVTNLGKMM